MGGVFGRVGVGEREWRGESGGKWGWDRELYGGEWGVENWSVVLEEVRVLSANKHVST